MTKSRFIALVFSVLVHSGAASAQNTSSLPPLETSQIARPTGDWLVTPETRRAVVARGTHPDEIVMTNGLIRRIWRMKPATATVAFDNLMTGESLLRAVQPEAVVEINAFKHNLGGLQGQPDMAYLAPAWLDKMTADPAAWRCVGFSAGPTQARFPWKRVRHCENRPWPPPGVLLKFDYQPTDEPRGVTVSVHYEMYDGIPLLCKWLTLRNGSDKPLTLNTFISELLAIVEPESAVDARTTWDKPNIHVESDYAFHGMDYRTADQTTHWERDPTYATQVSYDLLTPCLLHSKPPFGPDLVLEPGATFESFRTFELVPDSTDRERRGLAQRRMYRTIAPWITENPLMMHVRHADPATVKNAIDQCAEVGFEMVILSFGSGFDLENPAPETLTKAQELAAYAKSKGIEIGSYSLLASRSVNPEIDVINEKTGKPGGAIFGNSPCLGSPWGKAYFDRLYQFHRASGFTLLEHDGSYPGDPCASTKHPGHRGLSDSQWTQWKTITDFYKWCRAEGLYLNVPDYYFLCGSNKSGMGYRESNWSLPREQQLIHARQNIYDGTWTKTPSMGWMFVPLTEYHGGGPAATLEPLSEHLDDYEQHLALNLGLGVQACYRGPRLYDTEQTKALVKKWVDFYKKHRAILESDLIHLRRADGRDLDYMLHVNPALPEKGLVMIFNPLTETVTREIVLPLYYTGLTATARIREKDGEPREYALDREYKVRVNVSLPPHGITWFVIE